jgi:hypothetical protein
MTITRIPTSITDANYEFTISLDNVEYKLSFRFNSRDEAWYLTILTPDDIVLRAGIKVVNEWVLTRLWVAVNRPAGDLVTVNQGELLNPPLLDELGTKALLDYLDEAEAESLG